MLLTLEQFAKDFQQEIISLSEMEDAESFHEDQFTSGILDYLVDAGEFDDVTVCYHQARGIKVNGYAITHDDECLDLFVSIYTGQAPPERIGKSQVDAALRQVRTFLQKALNGYYLKLEESSPIFDLALRIHELSEAEDTLTRVRIFLLTDGIVNIERLEDEEIEELPVSYHIWDMERLFRWWSSGRAREKIEINFRERPGGVIPCLVLPEETPHYSTYLAIMPGPALVDIYSEYGPRLLERNVRSFLQARNKVNAGIRKTILEEPWMFLAYNNGISATAERVDVMTVKGRAVIKAITDLQIVNGAQTTASLYHAYRKDKKDVSQINVQVKITVIHEPDKLDQFVPRISEFANSQNKVNTADFSANDPFHRKIEELSRTVWAPAASGVQHQTHWFYERARGQYMDALAREFTPARKKKFEAINPRSKMFTKTDLAKFENTWDQLPHLVSRGAQKNFQELTIRLKERGKVDPDLRYFEHLIAKAILYRQTEKIVREQGFAGYRANIVTYTIALLSYLTAQCIDLNKIWKEQNISPALRETITSFSHQVHEFIIDPPRHANVTEWCKKEDCWKKCRELNVTLPAKLKGELIPLDRSKPADFNRGITVLSDEDIILIEAVKQVPGDTWLKLSRWARETDNLKPFQRGIAYSVGKILVAGGNPSRKQAIQASKLLKEAESLGFRR